jgi:hypothetical protein
VSGHVQIPVLTTRTPTRARTRTYTHIHTTHTHTHTHTRARARARSHTHTRTHAHTHTHTHNPSPLHRMSAQMNAAHEHDPDHDDIITSPDRDVRSRTAPPLPHRGAPLNTIAPLLTHTRSCFTHLSSLRRRLRLCLCLCVCACVFVCLRI